MKRILITVACICLAASAGAQDTYYAELLSRNNYYGTARSVALGNAMTALGGDLGSIGINPAGSAVNGYGQFTITPGLLIQGTGSSFSVDGSQSFGSPNWTGHTKFNIPNCGATMVLYTGNYSGIKYVTMGFVANNTNTFLNYATARGVNDRSSFLGNLAAAAEGLSVNDFYTDLSTSYSANQIGEYGKVGSNRYAGANQMIDNSDKYHYLPGALNQTATYNTYGSKTDLLFNLGFNVSDNFYFGVNLGFPLGQYRREDMFMEAAQSPEAFPVNFVDDDGMHIGTEGEPTTYFKSSSNGYKLNTEISGIYGKFGFIWLPAKSLRVGAAIQTPAAVTIEERWQYSASTSYANGYYNGGAKSNVGEYTYRLRTPYIFDLGVAYTLGGFGLLSLDYELTDYSVMKYSDLESNYFNEEAWANTNMCNGLFCGVSHSLRAGIEVKPLPQFALRAGYSLVTDPERYSTDSYGNRVTAENWQGPEQVLGDFHYFNNITNAVSLGAGYSSDGSFFADAAVRFTKYPDAYYNPYYYGDYVGYLSDGTMIEVPAPLVKLDRRVFDIILTFGWRF